MKNITQHFENTVKSSSGITIYSSDDTKVESKCKNDTKRKRNRVKIKISKKNAKERVCDILESSSDMVDKTPSPFTKLDNVDTDLHDTPKNSLAKLSTLIKNTKSSDQYFGNLALETNNVNPKNKTQSKNDSIELSLKKRRKFERELSNNIDNISGICENKDAVKEIDFIDDNSNDENKGSREGSNAFLILMSHNKLDHSVPPTKVSPKSDEIDVKKLEEQKEKLKCSKEKLLSLADKKVYSKRKLAELQESEKVERTIQNHIKLLKGQEKRDNCVETTALNSKQPPGSLLNYFSKIPVDLTHSNLTHMSTIVVKADVHMTDSSVTHNVYSPNCSNVIRPSRKCKKSNVELAQMEDISLVESEKINVLSNKNTQQDELQLNKHRWLLRVKIQAANDGHGSLDETSDEELYSPNVKVKLKAQRTMKSARSNIMNTNKISTQSKKKESKYRNDTKLALKKYVETETLEVEHVLQDYQNLGYDLKKNQKLININKSESALIKHTKRKIFNSSSNTNLISMGGEDTSKQNCIIIASNNSKRKTSDKLAPLFTKRRKPDPDVLAARRLFLHSDIIDNSNKNISRKVNISGTLSFPLISHVTQSSTDVYSKTDAFNIPREVCKRHVPIIHVNHFKQLMDFSEREIKVLDNVDKPEVHDALVDIEKHCTNAKKMWDVISLIVKEHPKKTVSPKARARKNKQLEKRGKMINKSKEDQFKCCSWTYKYRPKNSQEVVGNEEAVAKLKEWLIGWKEAFTKEGVSSEDEFYSDSNHSKAVERNKVAVLLGPHGCGKTASAYAVAEEFGYTVLELNASSRRTGKTILKELVEASKSHQIKRDDVTPILDDIVQKKMAQNSLILIEDVDIVFEEDEGFISAAYQLVLNTKRPIVMTCRDICPNLNRIAPQQNRIFFQDAAGNRVSALLELISLAETGYRLPPKCITELLQTGDLRRAILQLQYLLLSGPPQTLAQSINFKNAFWQNMWHCLYKPAIKINKRRKRKKTNDNEVLNDKYAVIDIAYKLDNIALLSCLIDIEDSALNLRKIKAQPNLSLSENIAPYSASNNICLEIAEWIGNKVMHKDELSEHDVIQTQNTIMLKKQLNNGVNLALSQTTSLLLDRHILATDYLPSVRAICRAEESRANTNNKRGKRFSHYLHNLKATSMLLKPNILTASCKIMYDKNV